MSVPLSRSLRRRLAGGQRTNLVRSFSTGFHHSNSRSEFRPLPLLAAAGILGCVSTVFCDAPAPMATDDESVTHAHEQHRDDLPTFTMADVAKHKSQEDGGMWVSFGLGVYDVTEFVERHPGGDKILMAVGSALEPFWAMYAVHKSAMVFRILNQYRIGNISAEEAEQKADPSDPFGEEPKRHALLQANSAKPFNAEPPPELLAENFVTPNAFFYVRNHLPVPVIEPAKYRLAVSGPGLKVGGEAPKQVTLDFLKSLPRRRVVATLQCAGNRRGEMSEAKFVRGLNWGNAAISNAEWVGASLRDVLLACGWDESLGSPRAQGVRHVWFEGLDRDASGGSYGSSIPVEYCLDPRRDIILAYEMNGEELPRDHGYPIRVLAPGILGARNVKWLGSIHLSDVESPSFWQQKDYKMFSPAANWDNINYADFESIQDLPIQASIVSPNPETRVVCESDETVTVRGYAFSGGGRGVTRVDVSPDAGKTWLKAQLVKPRDAGEDQEPGRVWAWTLWQVDVPLVPCKDGKASTMEICCKAVDTSGNVQPEKVDSIWNLRGVNSNAWSRIHITVEPDQEGDEKDTL